MKLIRPAALAVTSVAVVLASTGVAPSASAQTGRADVVRAAEQSPGAERDRSVPAVGTPAAQRRGGAPTVQAVPPVVGLGVLIAGVMSAVTRILDATNAGIASDNRVGVLQALKNAAWYEHAEGKNVLVIKNDHPYELLDMQGVVHDAVYTASGNPDFRVVVFDSGRVLNNGDGGYINWAFQGWFDRPSDGEVVFRRP